MSEFNLDLANRVMEQIKLHPGDHAQSSPSYCVVGWTVELANDEDQQVLRDYTGQTERDLLRYSWLTGVDRPTQAALMLGIPDHVARDIWMTMNNRSAKAKLRRLIDAELKRRRKVAKAEAKTAKAVAKQAEADAKRAARVEEETQRTLDLQAREQMRAHAKAARREKVSL